jgi:hypothetical protein
MADGSVYEIRLFETLLGQQVVNVFHYQSRGSSDITVSATAILTAWNSVIAAPLVAVQSNQVTLVQATLRHLVDGGAEATLVYSASTGTVSGDCLPPHDCFAFRYNRLTTSTRHGQKRIAGVPESWNVNGAVTDTAKLALLDTLAAAFFHKVDNADGLNAGAELWPIIYSTTLNGEPRTTPVINQVSSVGYVRLSTQNTRKVYR